MRPLALTTAASACDGGPMMAIDLPGAEPKVSAITTASQPDDDQRDRAGDPADGPKRTSSSHRSAQCSRPCLEVADDLDQAIDL